MKRIVLFILAVCLVLGIRTDTQAATIPYVCDEVGILSQDEVYKLEERAAEAAQKYGAEIFIYIMNDYTDYDNDIMDVAIDIFDSSGCGIGEGREGMILLLSMSARDYYLDVHGKFVNKAVNDYSINLIEDEFLDDFADDEWYNGFSDYIDKSSELLNCALEGNPVTVKSNPMYNVIKWGASALIAILIALFVGLIFKSKMKNVATGVDADNYVQDNSFDITYRDDRFTHSTESRRKIETKSSSSGGSGGHSGSGGKF
ncbi:MAG: TPM domain-containing protein [Lachnospiraceae bacterium]|nr:TPM domain-containing protein [Lachnospiraceae bacterium]